MAFRDQVNLFTNWSRNIYSLLNKDDVRLIPRADLLSAPKKWRLLKEILDYNDVSITSNDSLQRVLSLARKFDCEVDRKGKGKSRVQESVAETWK